MVMRNNFELNYIKYACCTGNVFSCNTEKEPEFIQTAVMSIFDGQTKNSNYNKIIDLKEFEQVSKENYNNYVNDIKSYYKEKTNKELKYHIPTYEELSEILKYGDTPRCFLFPLAFQVKKQEVSMSELKDIIIPTGEIGQFNQKASGECYQDAVDIALSYNEKGQQLLKKSLKKNYITGGYDVIFYGAKKDGKNKKPAIYHISQEELKSAQEEYFIDKNGALRKKYATGSAYVVLLDLALIKHRKAIKYRLLPKNTKEAKGYDDYLSGGNAAPYFELLTGKTGHTQRFLKYEESSAYPKGYVYKSLPDKKKKLNDYLKKVTANPDKYITCCMFGVSDEATRKELKAYNLYEFHAYAIKSFDIKGGYVTIANPHRGKYALIKLPIDVFEKFICCTHWIEV